MEADMDIKALNPVVVCSGIFDGSELPPGRLEKRYVYDLEIEYFIRSEGGIYVNDEFIRFRDGDINVRQPGQCVCGVLPYECYSVTINLDGDYERTRFYSPSYSGDVFRKIHYAQIRSLPALIPASKTKAIAQTMREIVISNQYKTEIGALRTKALAAQLIYELVLCSSENRIVSPITEVITYINSHFTQNITAAELTEISGLSKTTFYRQFMKKTGLTPVNYILNLRIQKAAGLLQSIDDEVPVAKIAELCGFLDQSYFTHLFKRFYGCTPSDLRKERAPVKLNAQA